MRYLRGAKAVAAAALLLAAVTACSGHGEDPTAISTASSGALTPTPPTTTHTTSAPPSATDRASRAASAQVRRYFTVVDHLRQFPTSPMSALSTVATSTQLSAMKALIRRERGDHLRQEGDTEVAVLRVQSVNLDNSDPSAGKVPTVQVDVCVNVSQVDILDQNGKSMVRRGRPDTGWTHYTVANYHYATDPRDGWRVATGQDLKRAPCAAS